MRFETNGEPLTIWGCSDDLVEFEGGARQEFACGTSAIIRIGDEEPMPGRGGVVVVMRYSPRKKIGFGCWTAEISQFGEDVSIPWEVKVGRGGHQSRAYSVLVSVDCPAGTKVKVTRTKGRKSE